MKFGMTEEQKMIRELLRNFLEREVAPGVSGLDEEERFDRTLFDRMAELGFTGIPWPESVGGSAGGFLSYVMVLEQLSRVSASMGAALWAHMFLAAWPVYRFGLTKLDQQQHYLQALIEGRKLGSGVLPQSVGGDSSLRIGVTAVPDGDGYILDGLQKYVFNGMDADLFVIYAQTGESGKIKRYSAFLIEKGIPGLHMQPVTKKLGLRSAGMAHMKFEQCRVPKGFQIGYNGQGGTIARLAARSVRYGLAAIASGIVKGSTDTALAYAKERSQFGKPIGQHQSIAFSLADMRTASDVSSLLVYQAAWREDQGLEYTEQSDMALYFTSDAAMASATNTVQILGGYGYMKDFPAERYMRDAKAIQIFQGLDSMRRKR
jgi:alkylation response protein AidB-like acyl-CoA dehydrogenase